MKNKYFLYVKKGQAGHDEPDDDTMKLHLLKSNKHLYDLKGQINHKVTDHSEFLIRHPYSNNLLVSCMILCQL